jgi:hypothetical protein
MAAHFWNNNNALAAIPTGAITARGQVVIWQAHRKNNVSAESGAAG